MKIGIVADSHDNIPMIKKAVEVFDAEKVDYVLHAGDYVAPFAVKEFLKAEAQLIGVFGNNDGEKNGIGMLCGHIYKPPYSIVLDEKRILLTHDINNLRQAPHPFPLPSGERVGEGSPLDTFDIIIFGHTHRPEIRLAPYNDTGKEEPLYINPGECGGWLSGKSTVSILDLNSLEAEIITL